MGVHIHTPRTAAATSWWVVPGVTCVCAYAPKGAATYAASKVNLANPGTYDAAEGVAPEWASATGWTYTWQEWLTTGATAGNGYSLLVRAAGEDDRPVAGSLSFYVLFGSGSKIKAAGSNYIEAPYTTKPSVIGLAGTGIYGDGVLLSSSLNGTGISGAVCVGSNGEATRHIGTIGAFVLYASTLTAGQMAAVSAAMAAL